MANDWNTKFRRLKNLKLSFANSQQFVNHVRTEFPLDNTLETLTVRVHYGPKSHSNGYYDDFKLEDVISISRILDRCYTELAKSVTFETDFIVFDSFLKGFSAMPSDLCFGSRVPSIETLN